MEQLTFGQLLKQARLSRGMSQGEVAGSAMTKAFVSLLEHDGAKPSLATLLHLTSRFDHPLAYWLAALDAKTVERTLGTLERDAQEALARRQYAAAQRMYTDLRALAENRRVLELELNATLGAGEALLGLRRSPEAEPCLRAALVRARADGRRFVECRALTGLGLVADRQGKLQDAASRYREALALIPSLAEPAPVLHGELLFYLSTILFRLGRIEEALNNANDALALLTEHAPHRTAEVRMTLGTIRHTLAEYEAALEEYRLGLLVAEQYEDLQTIFRIRKSIAVVLAECGQPQAALEHLEISLTMARRLSDMPGECQALSELARCHLALGAIAQARAVAEQAVGRSHSWGLLDTVASATIALGVASIAERQSQKALRYLTEAYERCRETGMLFDTIVAGHALARIASRHGKAADAMHVHNDVFEALGRLSPHEMYGAVQMTKTFDAILDRAFDPAAASVG